MKVVVGIVGQENTTIEMHVSVGDVLDRLIKKLEYKVAKKIIKEDAMKMRIAEATNHVVADKECKRIAFNICRVSLAKDGAEATRFFLAEVK